MNGVRTYNKDLPEWVQQQHKTMLRWINSKLGVQLTDLSTELCDGLVLIQLINKIISEMDVESTDMKLYLLKPLYTKPKLMLQKLENVNDFLEFIRLVLKISTTSISADNIVEGNLKLILGLLWSLFIFSTTSYMGIFNDGNSLIQIKKYMLNWINSKYKLAEVSNFDRDWSLDTSSPDMIFYSIAKCYMPMSNHIKPTESKYQNLKEILYFAESLGIPKLADIEDFKKLVPDEKCILFYILEWFKFFELGNFDNYENRDDETQQSEIDNDNEIFNETNDNVIITITDVIKAKLEYETKALRLSNKITSVNKKFEKLMGHNYDDFSDNLKKWDTEVSKIIYTADLNQLEINDDIKESINCLQQSINLITKDLNEYEDINNTLLLFASSEIHSLEYLQQEITYKLKSLDERFQFEITKNLKFEILKCKLDKLISFRNANITKIDDFTMCILNNTVLKKLDEHLKKIETFTVKNSNNDKLNRILTDFEMVSNFIEKVDHYCQHSQRTISLNEIAEKEGISFKSDPSLSQSYLNLKNQLIKFDSKLITNDMEFIFILQELTTKDLHINLLKSFMSFVPIKYVNLSINDSDFSLVLESEDEDSEIDNSKLIFENQRRKISTQLCHDKVFDLTDFFDKFENGLAF